MIKVLFFAKLREALDCSECSVALQETTVAALRERLMDEGGDVWRQALSAPNVLCAVNQQIAKNMQTVVAGDEVAFYPPVTGG